MNVGEESFKRVFYKVQVPEESIPTFYIRITNLELWFGLIFFIPGLFLIIDTIGSISKQDFANFTIFDNNTKGIVEYIDLKISDNDTLYLYKFSYKVDGSLYTNTGFSKRPYIYNVFDSVTVYYKKDYSISKAEFLDAYETPLWIYFLSILPFLLGSYEICKSERLNRKIVALMRNGIITNGVFQYYNEATEEDTYNFTYQYLDANKISHAIIGHTHSKTDIIKDLEILYSETNPNYAIVLNSNFMIRRADKDYFINLVHEYATELAES